MMQDLPKSDSMFLKPGNASFGFRAFQDGPHCQAVMGLNFHLSSATVIWPPNIYTLSLQACTSNENAHLQNLDCSAPSLSGR